MLKTRKLDYSLVLFVYIGLCLVPTVAFAQITNVTDDQSAPTPGVGHDYIKMFSETVTPANGQVSIRIQTPVPPGRKLSIPFAFAYDSSGTNHLFSAGPGLVWWTSNTSYLSQGGWAYSLPLVSETAAYIPNGELGDCGYYTNYMFEDPRGTRHALGLSVVPSNGAYQCAGLSSQPYSQLQGGDDFLQATTSADSPFVLTVADADGTVYHFPYPMNHSTSGSPGFSGLPDYIEDRNGNQVSVTDNGNGAFTMSDTLGRNAVVSSGFGTSGNTVTVSGLNPYTIYWGSASSNYSVSSTESNDLPNWSEPQK